MSEQIRCPQCDTTLRVPDDLLGKNVKCPKCQATFAAELDAPAEKEGISAEPSPPARRPSRQDVNDDYRYAEEEDDRPRRQRGNWSSAVAKDTVSGPATSLLVVGIIDIVLGVLSIVIYGLIGFLELEDAGRRRIADPDEAVVARMIGGSILGVGSIVFGILITMGAARMKKLNSYGFAMAACILAMIPCVNCCLLGLPFGIWGITVLNKPEVKDAFS